jgi:elongation factor Ts
MVDVTAASVKELRERTGAGMMDCKKALIESAGDAEAAADWLRAKGLAAAAKKAGRVASEGLIGIASTDTSATVIEVNTETDFVSRNESFQDYVKSLAELTLDYPSANALNDATYPGTAHNVAEQNSQMIATIGENITIRRALALTVQKGVVATYIHNSVAAGLGKIGVLVALESEADPEKLRELGKQLAMHVAATSPMAATVAELDPQAVERERSVLAQQAADSGKPPEIVEKMVEGRLRKYYEEVVLDQQTFVIDGESKIADVIKSSAEEFGSAITLAGFARYGLGEGIEKQETDFASEVAAVAAS